MSGPAKYLWKRHGSWSRKRALSYVSNILNGRCLINYAKPFYFRIGDSISIGIQPMLFPLLNQSLSTQHIPINGGNAKKGMRCLNEWTKGPKNETIKWDIVTFNFGLHSLDCCPPTDETESIANYTRELEIIGRSLLHRASRVIWISTTPVPLNVTSGPPRR